MTESFFNKDEDWEKRILCSDESCISTIGPDGKCKECGKSYKGELPEKNGASCCVAVEEQQKPVAPAMETKSDDWDKRVLCSDESCIGVIGLDGKCKECGKSL